MHVVDASRSERSAAPSLHRETIRRALADDRPPAYRHREKAPSKLDSP